MHPEGAKLPAPWPDTPPLGVRADVETTQAQVAATIARLLGEDYNAFCKQAAAPLPDVVRKPPKIRGGPASR
jgi:hypothetical protein